MAYIRKRGELQWRVEIRRKGFKTVSSTHDTKALAEAWARSAETEMDRGIFVDRAESERMTVTEIIGRFEKEFAPLHYKKREDNKEAWRFQCARLKEKLGEYSLAVLDQKIVAGYRNDRMEEVSGSTVRKELYLLSKILGFAEKECDISLPRGNPVLKIRIPPDGKARDRRLTEDEWNALMLQCQRSRNKLLWPIVEIATETAMRQSEILDITWGSLVLDRSILMTYDTKNGEDRAVPLSTRSIEIFKSLKPDIVPPKTKVFKKARLAVYHALVAAAKRAKIEDYTFHDLRHEALSRLAERGDMSMLELAEFSGHKTLQMLKRYTHLRAETLAQKLNGTNKELITK